MAFRRWCTAAFVAVMIASPGLVRSSLAEGLFLTANDTAPDVAASVALAPADSTELDLQLFNDASELVDLTVAQAAVAVRPVGIARGEVQVTLLPDASFFGTPATGFPSPDSMILTFQAGSRTPKAVASQSVALLSRLSLSASQDVRGEFELIALELDPVSFVTTSHWRPAGGLGLPFPMPTAYGNNPEADGGLLLATITIAVPEPAAASLLLGLMAGLAARCRRGA